MCRNYSAIERYQMELERAPTERKQTTDSLKNETGSVPSREQVRKMLIEIGADEVRMQLP